MRVRLRRILNQINVFLTDYYDHSAGCCAAGGLSVAQLEGKRSQPEGAQEPAGTGKSSPAINGAALDSNCPVD
jgi:hypothetical protein